MGEFPIPTSDHAGAVRDFGFCKVAKTCSQPWHMLVWQSDVKVGIESYLLAEEGVHGPPAVHVNFQTVSLQ
jgi:hypothetical protein